MILPGVFADKDNVKSIMVDKMKIEPVMISSKMAEQNHNFIVKENCKSLPAC